MSWFGLFGKQKAAPQRDASDAPVQQNYTFASGSRSTTSYRSVCSANDALAHPILFRILNKIAESVQTVSWYAESLPGTKAAAGDLKKINSLLQSPNDTMSPAQLKYWMALTFAAYRRIPMKIGKGVGGVPNAIYPLRNEWVKAKTDERGIIVSYEYGSLGATKASKSLRTAGKDEAFIFEIFTTALNATLDGSQSMSPLETLGMPAEITRMLLQRAHDTASGHPNVKYIVCAEKTLTDPQKRAIQNLIDNTGPGDDLSGTTLFMYNAKIEIHKLDNNLGDIHSKIPMDDMIRVMAGTYGVPIALVGIGGADAAKFAGNYQESRMSFWEDTIIPGYLVPIEDGMTQSLCAPGSNIRVRFDRDSIPALNDARVKTAVQLSQVTFLDQNEKREMVAFPPTDKVIENKPAVVKDPQSNL